MEGMRVLMWTLYDARIGGVGVDHVWPGWDTALCYSDRFQGVEIPEKKCLHVSHYLIIHNNLSWIQVLVFWFLKYINDYEWLVDAVTTTCMRVSFSYLATVQVYEIFSP